MAQERFVKTTFVVTPEQKRALAERCQEAEITMNDLMVRGAAEKLGLTFEPLDRWTKGNPPSPDAGFTIMLRMPERIHRKMRVELARQRSTVQAFLSAVVEAELARTWPRAA